MSRRRKPSGCDICASPATSFSARREKASATGGPALHAVLEEFDRRSQEVEALTELKRTAEEHYERAYAIEEAEEAKGGHALRGGQLWVRILDAETKLTEGRHGSTARRVSIELECEGHLVQSTSRAGAQQIVWQETYHLPLHHEAVYDQDVDLHVAFLCDGEHAHMSTHREPLHDLFDQRAQSRLCSLSDGWRVRLKLQWIHSASHLLRDHAEEFEAKLKVARAELLACQERLQDLVPREVWQNERE